MGLSSRPGPTARGPHFALRDPRLGRANFQEREIFDLMGIRFEGHPNLKRIMLWEGFDGHPLRKDFVLQRP